MSDVCTFQLSVNIPLLYSSLQLSRPHAQVSGENPNGVRRILCNGSSVETIAELLRIDELANSPWMILRRLILAAFLGAIVGLDREARGVAAGLRTHMMVSIGSAAFSLISLELLHLAREVGTSSGLGLDPFRITAAIIGGIGFIGAGAIIQSGGKVRGITTASSLWVVAAVGMSTGLGLHPIALVLTGLAVLTLTVVGLLERLLGTRGRDPGNER